jgi:hypothetical protein
MTDEKLIIEDIPSAGNGHRILRLTGPLVLNSFFAFQALVREDKSNALVLDFIAGRRCTAGTHSAASHKS